MMILDLITDSTFLPEKMTCACWQTKTGFISALWINPKQSLMTWCSLIWTCTPSLFVTTKMLGLKSVKCWMMNIYLRKTVSSSMIWSVLTAVHVRENPKCSKTACTLSSVKPNPPCCLTVLHNSSRHDFTWKSTYEEYSSLTTLPDRLKYQLRYYKRGDKHPVRFSVGISDWLIIML